VATRGLSVKIPETVEFMTGQSTIRALLVLWVFLVSAGCRSSAEMITQFESADEQHTQLRSELEASNIAELVQGLSNSVKLKQTIYVCFREDADGPRFSEGQIIIPYEFLSQTKSELQGEGYEFTPEEIDKIVLSQAKFVLFHEIGHALIEQFEIPVVGKEEDAVDGLATLLAVGVLKSPEIALCAAVALDASENPEDDYRQKDFWDEHSLTTQRYYSILCWVKGGAPEWAAKVARLAPEEWLESKGENCGHEYEKLARNWTKLLKPHLKPGVVIRQRIQNKTE
jgi:putative metallopeptidase DUF4344